MALYKDKVIIIKSVNFGEADKILTVFGEHHGKFPLIAKGIRKIASKNRGNMQTLSLSNISFVRNSGMGVLTETELIKSSEYPRECFKNIKRILFLLYKLIDEDQKEPIIFKELIKVLDNCFSDEIVNRFRMFFLFKMGFIADYKKCSICGKLAVKESDFIKKDTLEIVCSDCANLRDKLVPLNLSKSEMLVVLDNFVEFVVSA